MLSAAQIQRIYGMGATLGMVDRDRQDDALHDLVSGLTGKGSIRQLSYAEYQSVADELIQRIKISQMDAPPPKPRRQKKYMEAPGGITSGQQKKVWYLMYQLQGCDKQACPTSLGERLCGIIKREIGMDATAKQPLRWLTYQQGAKLIERLKQYVKSAEQKAMRGD